MTRRRSNDLVGPGGDKNASPKHQGAHMAGRGGKVKGNVLKYFDYPP